MPHQCTNCGHVFPDGSKDMLSGCPECGGNKFQYHAGEVPDDAGPDDSGGVSDAVGRAAATVRDFVGDDDAPPETAPSDAAGGTASAGQSPASSQSSDGSPTAAADSTGDVPPGGAEDATGAVAEDDAQAVAEDDAQASARSEMVDTNDIPPSASDGRVVKEPDVGEADADPDMEALREELNDQFESIRIVEPGQYELNLMELYDREEYIIALQENGRYVIEVPDAWDAIEDA